MKIEKTGAGEIRLAMPLQLPQAPGMRKHMIGEVNIYQTEDGPNNLHDEHFV